MMIMSSLASSRKSGHHGAESHIGATTMVAARSARILASTRGSNPQGGLAQPRSLLQSSENASVAIASALRNLETKRGTERRSKTVGGYPSGKP